MTSWIFSLFHNHIFSLHAYNVLSFFSRPRLISSVSDINKLSSRYLTLLRLRPPIINTSGYTALLELSYDTS